MPKVEENQHWGKVLGKALTTFGAWVHSPVAPRENSLLSRLYVGDNLVDLHQILCIRHVITRGYAEKCPWIYEKLRTS